ncbi:hypothetical protein BC830DRAFT_1130539 [Chytriomyces sp. MP71]|nr:hypothetical protein BC830DRAFT_1130539 [Chytriomyces sp. MP71]
MPYWPSKTMRELVSMGTVTASSTDETGCKGGPCAASNVKETSLNDAQSHPLYWMSAADAQCGPVSISADWRRKGARNGYTVSAMSVLYTSHDARAPTNNLVLTHKDGSTSDVSAYLLCTPTMLADNDGDDVRWDICTFDHSAPDGTYNNVVGATWTFQPTRPPPSRPKATSTTSIPPASTSSLIAEFTSASVATSSSAAASATTLPATTITNANNTVVRRQQSDLPPCQMGIYELQLQGIQTPRIAVPPAGIAGIVVASTIVVFLLLVCCVLRKASTRKSLANWLMQPKGGFKTVPLALWEDEEEVFVIDNEECFKD